MRYDQLNKPFRFDYNDASIVYVSIRSSEFPDIEGVRGFEAAYSPTERAGWIEVLETTPEARGKGIGRKVIEWFEQWVKAHGGTEIRCESLASAVPFWAKVGFEPVANVQKGGKDAHRYRAEKNRTFMKKVLDVNMVYK